MRSTPHSLYVGSVLERLLEVADFASHILVASERQRDDRLQRELARLVQFRGMGPPGINIGFCGELERTIKQKVNQGLLFRTRARWFPQL